MKNLKKMTLANGLRLIMVPQATSMAATVLILVEAGSEYDFTRDRRYAGSPIPDTESLKTTLDRVLPYWTAEIAPKLTAGETLLVAAHGNSLRAIVKHLFAVPDDKITGVEIPTGNPLIIELDGALKPTAARYLDEAREEPLPPIG